MEAAETAWHAAGQHGWNLRSGCRGWRMQHTRCLHAQHPHKPIHAPPHLCTPVHAQLCTPDLAAFQLPAQQRIPEPATSSLRPTSRSRAAPVGAGSPQNRPSLLPSSSCPLLSNHPPPTRAALCSSSAPLPSLCASLHTSHSFSLLFLCSQLFPFLQP